MLHVMMILNDTFFAYNLRLEILQRFIREGYKTSLVAQSVKHADDIAQLGVNVINLSVKRKSKNPLDELSLFRKYYKILNTEKPDVVFTNSIKANVYATMACQILHIPYIVNVCGLGTPLEIPGLMQQISISLYRFGVRGASGVFFQNTDNREFFHKHHMLRKNAHTVLLPGSGVALNRFPVLPYPDSKEIHFLFVARLQKEKGIYLYLNAARKVKKQHENTVFHICGNYDDVQCLDAVIQAEKEGVVVYHGEQRDMHPFYEQASCLVHPSYYPEGMSNVLLEAASSGRPVIATNRSGCRETVENNVSGYVVPIQDQEALDNALFLFLSLTHDQKVAMGLAGRAKVEKEFDRQIVVDKYIEEIARINTKN